MVGTLAGLDGLAPLPARKLRLLAERLVVRLFDRDDVINDRASNYHVYILISGVAKLTCLNYRRERVLLEVMGPGDVVAIPSLLPPVRPNVRLRAFTECRIGLLDAESLIDGVMGMNFDRFSHALGLTCGRWWQLLMRHSLFMEQSLPERVVLALLDLASKIGTRKRGRDAFVVELTHQDLAHLVIGSRAKVSACLAQLAAQDAIVQEGRTRIVVMPEKLRQFGNFDDLWRG